MSVVNSFYKPGSSTWLTFYHFKEIFKGGDHGVKIQMYILIVSFKVQVNEEFVMGSNMKCTRCYKEINEGEIVYVAHEYSDDLDLPFCSYECLGRYFCNYEEQVSKELIDFCDKAKYKSDALSEWIYG